jgi:predicted nucleic acid-binding protein
VPVASSRRFYVDTSAYLCVLLGEQGAEAVEKEIAGGQLLSSVLLVLEANRNLIRLTRAGALSADRYRLCIERLRQDREGFSLRDLTIELWE